VHTVEGRQAKEGQHTLDTEVDFEAIARDLEGKGPEAALAWALGAFHPHVVIASSFGLEDVCLIHMAHRIRPDVRVFYLDTDLLFAETYDTIDRLARALSMTFTRVPASLTLKEQAELHGPGLWARDPDRCCELRKVIPLMGVLSGERAWVTGIRRDQSPARRGARIVEWDAKFSLVKVNPLAPWRVEDVRAYIEAHDVPYNRLHDSGYPSIGCLPCTRPVKPGEDPRSGRWAGRDKTECGLHQ